MKIPLLPSGKRDLYLFSEKKIKGALSRRRELIHIHLEVNMNTFMQQLRQQQLKQVAFQQRLQEVTRQPQTSTRTIKGLGGEIILNKR